MTGTVQTDEAAVVNTSPRDLKNESMPEVSSISLLLRCADEYASTYEQRTPVGAVRARRKDNTRARRDADAGARARNACDEYPPRGARRSRTVYIHKRQVESLSSPPRERELFHASKALSKPRLRPAWEFLDLPAPQPDYLPPHMGETYPSTMHGVSESVWCIVSNVGRVSSLTCGMEGYLSRLPCPCTSVVYGMSGAVRLRVVGCFSPSSCACVCLAMCPGARRR